MIDAGQVFAPFSDLDRGSLPVALGLVDFGPVVLFVLLSAILATSVSLVVDWKSVSSG